MDHKKIFLIIIIAIAIIIAALYSYTSEPAQTGVVTPVVDTVDVGTVPNINPAANANPLKGVKTNPFD